MADPGFTNGGGKDEAPQPPREVGCWEGVPSPGVWEGAMPTPQKKNSILDLKMATLGAF